MVILPDKIKNLLFPGFSEGDAFALIVSSVLTIIQKQTKIVDFFTKDPDPRYLIILAAIGFWIIIVFKNIFSMRNIPHTEKITLARTYFVIVGILSVVSGMEYLTTPTHRNVVGAPSFEIINAAIVFFILVRSLLSLGFLRVFRDEMHELATQVKDDQTNSREILFVFAFALLFHFAFTRYSSAANAVLMNYFFTTSVVNFLKPTLIKN